MKVLTDELKGILSEAAGEAEEPQLREDEPASDDEPICEDTQTPCWHLQEAAQFVAEDISEVTGLGVEVLSAALTEAMKCDSKCGEKYLTAKGDFKGGRGDAFKTCEQYANNCCSGVSDPAAFCAYLGRRAGKIG
jgi:hypothetical protein